jgi:hypothetical protein
LNLAGVRLALDIQDKVVKIKKQLAQAELNEAKKKKLLKALDEGLIVLGAEPEEESGENGGSK